MLLYGGVQKVGGPCNPLVDAALPGGVQPTFSGIKSLGGSMLSAGAVLSLLKQFGRGRHSGLPFRQIAVL
jgi:hypothetical protein